MNLFIEPTRQGSRRSLVDASRVDCVPDGQVAEDRGVFHPPASPVREDACGTTGSLPVSGAERGPSSHPYSDEVAYDRRRSKRSKRRGVLRAVAMLVAVPAVLAIAFVSSYVLTLIAGGATPEEIVELLHNLWSRLHGAAYHLLGMV